MKTIVKNISTNIDRSIEQTYMVYGAAATFFLIFSLTIYHFLVNEFIIGLVDLSISFVLLFVGVKLDQPKQIKHLNIVLVILLLISLTFAILLKGIDTLYWAFPLISATFFMLPKRYALLFTLVCISLTYIIAFPHITRSHFLDYYPALFLHSFFQYIWSSRTACQQDWLYELATKDALTKVNNRLSFNEKIDRVIKRIKRNKVPVSLLMLDLDHFKKINDKLGHDKGDEVLSKFAQTIKRNIRKSDSIYRYGGEEFIVIAENTGIQHATRLAEFLRKKTQNNPFLKKYGVTVSTGVIEVLPTTDDSSTVLQRADNALYKAKNNGRNCVFVS